MDGQVQRRDQGGSKGGAGLLVGISAAAAVVGCLKIARELPIKKGQRAVIVTILCDSGEKYLSERFWTEE